jgi:hypothetical protein
VSDRTISLPLWLVRSILTALTAMIKSPQFFTFPWASRVHRDQFHLRNLLHNLGFGLSEPKVVKVRVEMPSDVVGVNEGALNELLGMIHENHPDYTFTIENGNG